MTGRPDNGYQEAGRLITEAVELLVAKSRAQDAAIDRLRTELAYMRQDIGGSGPNVVRLEPRWLDKRELAQRLGCSVRWVENAARKGMPSAMIAGRRKFRFSEVEPWLEEHGHLERRGEAA